MVVLSVFQEIFVSSLQVHCVVYVNDTMICLYLELTLKMDLKL